MLFFDNLKNLDKHITFLTKSIKDPNTLFLVGGCVRDLLLGIEKKPTDIDFTMAGNPTTLYERMDTTGLSHFMTEKFGTITLIHKQPKTSGKMGKNISNSSDLSNSLSNSLVIKYECTPLRTEGKYDDYRHPEEIQRSNDLILDSQRRDFTINCMYYTTTPYKAEYATVLKHKNIQKYTDEIFMRRLDMNGYLYINDLQLLVVQDHTHISKLFPEGRFDEEYLVKILKSTTIFTTGKKQKSESRKKKTFRILIDPHKGINDSIHKRLRAVGDPDKRFNEDALRIIRAIRFVNVLNEKLKQGIRHKTQGTKLLKNDNKVILFDFEKATWNSLKKNHDLVKHVAKERIKEEIMKAFTVGNPFGFVSLLDEAQLLHHLFPALAKTKNVEQPIRYHPFDVYTHTLLALLELQKTNKDPLVRLAMLYHDVGKVGQFGAYKEGLSKEEIREILKGPLNHRRSSPEYAKRDFKALGFSNKEIILIARYIAHHHKPEEMIFAKEENTEKKVRLFFSDAGYEKAMNIMDITLADRLGQFNPIQNGSDISDVNTLKAILKKLHKQEGQFTMRNLAIDGDDIIKEFNLKPSPIIGKLLKKTLEWVMSDIKKRNTKKEIFGFIKTQMKHIISNE